jgi:hypothetical protein
MTLMTFGVKVAPRDDELEPHGPPPQFGVWS